MTIEFLERAFDPSEPRDERGRWEGDGGDSGDGGGKGEHPGKGYSASAYVKDGVIHTNSVYDAQRALNENRKVELDQPKSVSILIQRLGEVSKKMIAEGKKAPNFNLCNVSLKGTNLFCADNVGLTRIKMPQLDKQQTKDFQKYLKNEGYKLRKDKEHAANLRATQNELIGAKVAAGAEKIEANDGKVKPIIISKDDYILDGHHAWAAKLGLDAADNILANDTKMNVVRVNIKITKLLEEADKFTGGKGRKGADERNFVSFGEVFRDWNESEPRDEQGRWTAGGGGGDSSPGYEFVSPNVGELKFEGAVKELGSDRQGVLNAATEDINDKLGINAQHYDVIGAWKDGAENSTMSIIGGSDWEKMKLSASMKGWVADQKSVLIFQQNDKDNSVLAQFAAQGNLTEIHEALLADGIENHTLVPTATGAMVYVADLENTQSAAIKQAASRYGEDNPIDLHFGRGEFVGAPWDFQGSDRETRDAARNIYEANIERSPVQGGQEVWDGIRDRWGKALAESDTSLTARKVYVRPIILKAFEALTAAMVSGMEVVPYCGEYIPGTELIDLSEWEERDLPFAVWEERGEYDESKHPRGEGGRWTDSGGGGGGGGDESIAAGNVAQTKTPEFKRWFGDSKVVDKNGDPLVVYHGTRSEISEFRPGEGPYRGGVIAFFSTSPKFASGYAENPQEMDDGGGEGGNVIPVYLKIEHPFDYRTDWADAEEFYSQTGGVTDDQEANRILMGLGKLPEDQDIMTGPGASALTEEDFVKAVKEGAWDAIENDEFVEFLRGGGADGIVETEGVYDDNGKQIGSAVNYGIFEPTQVKSAIGNTGDFDPDNPDITKSADDFIQDPTTGHLMGRHPGGGGDKGGGDKGEGKPPEPSPEVMAVGGDEWNKQTAERLEKEYVEAEPALEKIISEAVAKETKVEDPEDVEEPDPDNAPVVPEEWAMLSDEQQSDVEAAWKSNTESQYMDSEIESWQESGGSTDDAGNKLAYDFKDGTNIDWAKDAIAEYASQWVDEHDDKELPFTNLQLLDAMVVNYEASGSGYDNFRKDLDISFDDSKLDHPAGWSDEPMLPGIEPKDPSSMLTKEMRDGLIDSLSEAFAKEGEKVRDNLDPPEYLKESVEEYQDQYWGDMQDKEKFALAEKYTDIVSDAQKEYDAYFGKSDKPVADTPFVMPKNLDPLQEEGGKDYAGTQKVARLLSVERAAQLMVARGVYESGDPEDFVNAQEFEKWKAGQWEKWGEKARADAKRMDRVLWDGWKGSSSGNEGQLLQQATADELGGRLNPMMVSLTKSNLDNFSVPYAPNAASGKSYEAVKAYVRGKWETSQYLLKKAGLDTVNVYRGVDIPDAAPPSILGPGTGGDYRVTATKTFDDESSANKYMEDRAAEHGKDYSGSISKFHDSYRVLNKYEFRDKAKAEAFAKKYETDPDNPEQHKEEVAGTSSIPDKYSSAPPPKFTRLPDIHIDRNGAASTTTTSTVANAWDGGSGRVVLRASVPRTAVVSVPAYGINIVGEHEVVVAGTAWKGWDAWKGAAPLHEQVKIGHQIVGHPDA